MTEREHYYIMGGKGVKALMTEAGEDPGNVTLFRLRCVQVAYSVKANAERAWDGRAT